MMITGFDSLRDYFRFAFAKGYLTTDAQPVRYGMERNIIEKMGDLFVYATHKSVDNLIKQSRHPAFVVSMGVLASGVATFVWFPEWTSEWIVALTPAVALITPELIRRVGYVFSETTIAGYTLRTLGRLSNRDLMERWVRHEIKPIYAGDIR